MRNKDDDTEICTIKRDKKAMVVRYIFAVINGLILQGRKMSLFHRFRKDKQRGTKKQNMVQRVGNHLRICLDILDG